MAKAWLAGLLLAAFAVSAGTSAQILSQENARAALAALLQREASGFASAHDPWRFRFPADHGPHPAYRTESWRFTGSVVAEGGRRFGFQLTFFRLGIVPPQVALGPSSWAARDVYWTQLALSDAAEGRQIHFERLARGAPGIAGAEARPARVWVEDWVMDARETAAGARFHLSAIAQDVAIALSLQPLKRPLTRTAGSGDGASAAGSPFHAYFVSRLGVQGTVSIEGHAYEVSGAGWLDHAWGELPLPLGAVVWDRFVLQLDGGRELMVLRLRRADGSGEPVLTGLFVEADARVSVLDQGEIALEKIGARWRLSVPGRQFAVELEPYAAGEQSRQSLQSWHAVRVHGTAQGHGHVEIAQPGSAIVRR